MVNRLNKASTYIIILFVVGIFSTLIVDLGIQISNSPESNLSDGSKAYISEITGGDKNLGFDPNIYDEDIGKATELGGNDNKNDFALDFSFGDKTGTKLERTTYLITNVPEFYLVDVFRLTEEGWIIDLLDWAMAIFLFMATVSFIRKGE